MSMNETYDAIKAMFGMIPRREGWKSPQFVVCGKRHYRGKEQFVAGYSHSRTYAHYAKGLCYDRILGWGDTQLAAIQKMSLNIDKLRAK